MSAAVSKPPFVAFEEYLRREAVSEQRHDYVDGQIIAMAGGSVNHSTIVSNVIGEVRQRLKGKPCRIFDPNLRLGSTGLAKTHYPDAMIVCGPVQYDERDASKQTVLNPTVIIEVLSPSTEQYDRAEKFDHYRTLDSLHEYVLIRQDRPEVHTYFRQDDGTWTLRILNGLDAMLPLASVQIDVPLQELYDRVTFEPLLDENTAAG